MQAKRQREKEGKDWTTIIFCAFWILCWERNMILFEGHHLNTLVEFIDRLSN